jgi:hypothetical protein
MTMVLTVVVVVLEVAVPLTTLKELVVRGIPHQLLHPKAIMARILSMVVLIRVAVGVELVRRHPGLCRVLV